MGHDQDHKSCIHGALRCGLNRQKAHSHKDLCHGQKILKGTKVVAVSTVALTAGVLAAEIGLTTGLIFMGFTAAAGGSSAMVGGKILWKARDRYNQQQASKSFYLSVVTKTRVEAVCWQ